VRRNNRYNTVQNSCRGYTSVWVGWQAASAHVLPCRLPNTELCHSPALTMSMQLNSAAICAQLLLCRCHRVLLALVFSGLDRHISVGRLADIPEQATRGGWVFQPGVDPVTGARDLW
jgi:hypothetical protein